MKSLSIVAKSLLVIVAMMFLVGVWVSPAAAQTPERDYSQLEYGLKRALIRLDALGDRIENITAAADLVRGRRIPIGLLYKKAGESVPLHQRLAEAKAKGNIEQASVEKLLQSMVIA